MGTPIGELSLSVAARGGTKLVQTLGWQFLDACALHSQPHSSRNLESTSCLELILGIGGMT